MHRSVAKLRERLERPDRESGFTMLEVVVVMTIMAIVLALFTTGISQAFSAEDRVTASTSSESQLTIAFQRLDKEIRYAAGISTPGIVGTDQYVEILTTFSGTPTCTELRVHTATAQLQQRSWTQGASPLVPGAWVQLASSVSSAAPFTLVQAGADPNFNFQRLEITLTILNGTNSTASSKQSDITFTALDTSLTTSSGSTCTEGRAIS